MSKKESLKKSVHFIGIGGSGMSGLAELALRRGYKVSGSDVADSDSIKKLMALGIEISSVHRAENIKLDATVVYSSAIKADNSELSAATLHGNNALHRSEFLAILMADKKQITVAGTHGKTTTSAMIVHMLDVMGADPDAVIGGVMSNSGNSYRYGEGDLFVAEADESDGSFLRYSPFISVLTNVDSDHMEYFKTTDRCVAAFSEYLKKTDVDGVAIVGWDSPLARTASESVSDRRLTYGFVLGCEVRGVNIVSKDGITSFTAVVERDQVKCKIKLPGRHNVQNALCALAVARALDLDITKAAGALESFSGAERRLSLVAHGNGAWVYDDYAHNPGKITACLSSIKEMWPEKKLIAVFQAHRYSRLQTMHKSMMESFAAADLVVTLPVYAAGEPVVAGYTPLEICSEISKFSETRAIPANDFAQAVNLVCAELSPQVIIVTVGAGDVWNVAKMLREKLNGQTPSP